MKKQFILKLLALAMALAMLPVVVLAANNVVDTVGSVGASSNAYPDHEPPVEEEEPPVEEEEPKKPTTEKTTPSTSNEVVEKIDDVKTETNAAGQTVVTATIEAKSATASVEVSEAAVDALVSQAKAGEVVSIVAKTSGTVSAPAAKLAALVEKTGNAVNVGNSVAAAKVNKALLDLSGGAELKIAPVKNTDGTINIPVMAGDKTIAPEDVPGGIDVEVPVDYTADEVSAVNAVKADKTEVELVWSIDLGNLQVNLTVTGAIKIVPKK